MSGKMIVEGLKDAARHAREQNRYRFKKGLRVEAIIREVIRQNYYPGYFDDDWMSRVAKKLASMHFKAMDEKIKSIQQTKEGE